MDHSEFIEELSTKYGYDEELKIAIGITIPLMINHYGKSRTNDIYELFENTEIFATTDMSKANRVRMEQEILGTDKTNFNEELDKLYSTSSNPSSVYEYQAIYDKNMNLIGEVRWILVLDMKNSWNGQNYKNTFGTTINLPYFIHEMGHAFGMQKAIYGKEGNKIYSKHGMYEEFTFYERKENGVELQSFGLNHIILEEGINEYDTQCMLTDFFCVGEYDEVDTILRNIGHLFASYNCIIVYLAEKLNKLLGRTKLLQYRVDNDESVIEEFNLIASQSDIAKKYCGNIKPFKMLDEKMYELFLLEQEKHTMPTDEYGKRMAELMEDGLAPLCAYQDKKYGTMTLSTYEEIREEIGVQRESKKVKAKTPNKKI